MVSGDGNNECTTKLVVKCGKNRGDSINFGFNVVISFSDFNNPLKPYDGQLSLCAADTTLPKLNNNTRYSISFGMVSLYKLETDTWRGVDQNVSNTFLGSDEGDTICRQMGYTGAVPGSAIAKSASTFTFSNC